MDNDIYDDTIVDIHDNEESPYIYHKIIDKSNMNNDDLFEHIHNSYSIIVDYIEENNLPFLTRDDEFGILYELIIQDQQNH